MGGLQTATTGSHGTPKTRGRFVRIDIRPDTISSAWDDRYDPGGARAMDPKTTRFAFFETKSCTAVRGVATHDLGVSCVGSDWKIYRPPDEFWRLIETVALIWSLQRKTVAIRDCF
jgi:hypothetical protein